MTPSTSLLEQYAMVDEAFSRQASIFDSIEEGNAILEWMRARTRAQVLELLRPSSHILELNAGTGLDAAYFARQGHFVHATDLSAGMVAHIQARIREQSLDGQVTAEQRSYTDLAGLPAGAFDCIFSNFGGLNCVPDLRPVVEQFARLLKPGGEVVLVVMPKFSPWEVAAMLKGHFRLAFRRFRKGGVVAQVEGSPIGTWYFDPAPLQRAFGPSYTSLGWKSLGALVPPPHMEAFPRRFPWLFKMLCNLEDRLGGLPPFRSWADHYILRLRYRS